ncbi:MAG: biopolymer transporter ExbD [Verrucomicrobiales bacterium]|nr:biopolymer transporter ExbD [Verrucomicrobiales bacterium]
MQFTTRKRRQPPAIIIISLIDILIVLLIFLMVTTTFKQRPAVRITLPESKQAKPGASDDSLVVTIRNEEPFFYFKRDQVTLEKLQQNLESVAKSRPGISLTIEVDQNATFDNWLKVVDAAKAAGIENYKVGARVPSGK